MLRFIIYNSFMLVCLWSPTTQALSAEPYYTAGVVEFHPSADVEDNLRGYLELIRSDAASPTDIIVFPEATLNEPINATYVPPAILPPTVLCDYQNNSVYEDFLVQLSCEAKITRKYIVINVVEKENCTEIDPRPCAANGLNIFNTNVVFDRNGAIASRYRKVHLYGEKKNTTMQPEFGIFETDFGVRFGHFICFDILFYTPAQEMIVKQDALQIRDFIYTTMWFSQLPFLTSVQIQSSWAYANDVNLLAAGASNPSVGSIGVGIHAGRKGILMASISKQQNQRKLHVARVPKLLQVQTPRPPVPGSRSLARMPVTSEILDQTELFLKRDYLENYKSEIINLNASTVDESKMCFSDGFCCNFTLSWKHLNATAGTASYIYRKGVYSGWRNTRAAEKNYIRTCAIFTCTSEDIMDCGKIFPDGAQNVEPHVEFEYVAIEGRYPNREVNLLMPNSLRTDLLPLNTTEFIWTMEKIDDTNNARIQLKNSSRNLLTFAIYGNYFENEPRGDNSAAGMMTSFLLLAMCFIVTLW